MARSGLTIQAIESAQPRKSAYRLYDPKVPGLSLRVLPSGAKTWNIAWKRNRDLTIGKYPIVTLDAARSRARRMLAEADEHGAPLVLSDNVRADISWGTFIDDHYAPHVQATAKSGAATVAALNKQFGYLSDKPLSAIARIDFDTFKAARLKAGIQPATVNRDLDRIKAALSQAVAWDMLGANPLAGVKRVKRDIEERARYLSVEEEKALRAALDSRESGARSQRQSGEAWRAKRGYPLLGPVEGFVDHLTPMTVLALNTGLRRGELTQLKWSDIDLDGKRLTVRAGNAKSGIARHVPLNREALGILQTYRKQSGGEGRIFNVDTIKTAWGHLMKRANLSDFRFHDLRHTFASKLVMRGVDLNTVRELLGHSDITMTLRYAHLAPEHKASAVEKLLDRPADQSPRKSRGKQKRK